MKTTMKLGIMSHLLLAGLVMVFLLSVGSERAYAGYMVKTQAIAFPFSTYEAVADYNVYQPVVPYPSAVGSAFYTDPNPLAFYNCTATGTVDGTGTLTASNDTATAVSNKNFFDYYGVPPGSLVSSASAAADLSTGKLKASGSGTPNSTQEGIGQTAFNDVIHYTVAGANATTITNVNLQFSLTGSVSSDPNHPGVAFYDWNMIFGNASLYVSTIDNGASGNVLKVYAPYPGASGWVSYKYISQDPANFIFDGVYALQGASGDIAVSGALNVEAEGMSADFSNTAIYGLSLPPGVTYTSDSGVFLTGSQNNQVPEPATTLLLGLGLMGLAGVRRKFKQ